MRATNRVVYLAADKGDESLTRIKARCEKQKHDPLRVEREICRILRKNLRAAKLFNVKVTKTDTDATHRMVKGRSHTQLGDTERRMLPAPHEIWPTGQTKNCGRRTSS